MIALLLVLALAAPGGEAPTPSYRMGDIPPRLASGVAVADAAMGALQRRLSARLLEELPKGAIPAIGICRDEAPALTAEVARSHGIRVGRTSHRLRNPRNVPPAWAEGPVAASAGRKAAEIEALAVDLGDRVGVLRPIATAAPCLRCHGPAVAPEVQAVLRTAYPADRAIGFAEGDLRGFLWAEAPVAALAGTSGFAPEAADARGPHLASVGP